LNQAGEAQSTKAHQNNPVPAPHLPFDYLFRLEGLCAGNLLVAEPIANDINAPQGSGVIL